MKISKTLTDVINDQINHELYSGYIYLSMATWFEERGLHGMAKWMKVQAKEEYSHAVKFWEHIVDRGSRVVLTTIKGPKTVWKSPLEAWDDAYNHESNVTKRIHKIGEITKKEEDEKATIILEWFYEEQKEEEEQTKKVRDKLARIGKDIKSLQELDRELGKRAK